VLGEIAPRPRSSLATALLSVTGIAALVQVLRLLARLVLAYRRPAEMILTEKDVRVRWRTELLGRTVNEHDVVLPRSELSRAVREVRYPSLGLYTGLFALAVGSFFGVSTLVDGLRVSSVPVAALGFAAVALGVAVDFVLSSLAPGRRGRCKVLVVPRRGSPICIGGVEMDSAEAFVARLGSGNVPT
jgi:hypothetical protein